MTLCALLRKKKAVALVWLGLALLGSSSSSLVMGDKTEYTFAVVPKRINSPYWQTVQRGCETRARVLSRALDLKITCLFTGPAEGGPETETNQLNILEDLLLDDNIDGLALAVVEAPSATDMIARFAAQNLPVVTFDSDAINSERLAYIGTNNYEMGAELGRVVLQVTDNVDDIENEKACSFGIVGAGSPNIAERMQGVRDILTDAGWTEVSSSPKDCVGDPVVAMQDMHDLVSQHPQISAIIPVGAWPMQETDLWMEFVDLNPRVFTVVGDSLQFQIDLINMGYVNALVGQLPFEMGKLAIDKLLEARQAQENDLPVTFPTGKHALIETNFLNVINIPRDLPPLVQDMNYIGQWRILGYTLAGIVITMSLFFAMWTLINFHTRVVKASQPIFLLMICVGTLIMASTIFPLGIDDEHTSDRGCDIACMASPWLYSIGFVISFSALFSKTWRVNKVFHNPSHFRRVRVTEADVLKPFVALLVANVIVLICWTTLNPLRFERQPHSGTDNWNRVYKSFYGSCVSSSHREDGYEGSAIYVVLLVAINLIALVIAAIQGYEARHIHVEFSESQYIAFAVVCLLEAFLVGVPIIFLLQENPVSSFIVKTILIFFTSAAVLLFSFVPKLVRAKDVKRGSRGRLFENDNDGPGLRVSSSPGSANSGAREKIDIKDLREDDEGDQLKFKVLEVGLPVSMSIRASLAAQRNGLNMRRNDICANSNRSSSCDADKLHHMSKIRESNSASEGGVVSGRISSVSNLSAPEDNASDVSTNETSREFER